LSGLVRDPHFRPVATLVGIVVLLTILDWGDGRFLSAATLFSVLQSFATFGLVALGLGLTMLIREFDLSVAGLFGMAGCVAVLTGAADPWLGLALAVVVGVAVGAVQGSIIAGLGLGSVGVTLGGLLIAVGIAFVLTESRSLTYSKMETALALNERIGGVFSLRSLVTIGFFAAAALLVSFTRMGRDLIAIGSDRRAATTAGVDIKALVIGTFAFSGAMAALSGVMLSYSLASASPSGLSDVLVPAVTGAILGGVSLGGGTGRPLGIAAGVLSLSVLRSGLNAIGAPPFANDIAIGAILLAVAVLDGPYFARRARDILAWLPGRRAA
jgi:ribose/xylose/arabinose/galactoside ABC-type transport system permease subunit